MKRVLLLSILTLACVMLLTSPALADEAYEFPSTNEINQTNGWPHVDVTKIGGGFVILNFVNPTNSLAFFEIRIDGESLTEGKAHPVVTGDFMYPGVAADGRGTAEPVSVSYKIKAKHMVEVRMALGGERDWDFDWTSFDVRGRRS